MDADNPTLAEAKTAEEVAVPTPSLSPSAQKALHELQALSEAKKKNTTTTVVRFSSHD